MASDKIPTSPVDVPPVQNRPVVFLGPSMSVADARRLLDADYRPPVRRGDLDDIPAGSVVGIVDGVFDQELAVSPMEIRRALARGVLIAGASSMGALRAAEVPGVRGVGRVYAMYRDGVVERDDEVAVAFDADSGRALCEPVVNVRYAVERLTRSGTLDARVGGAIVDAARRLYYRDRRYRHILREAGITGPAADSLEALLKGYDLKREDAQTLLEALPSLAREASDAPVAHAVSEEHPEHAEPAPEVVAATAPVLVWELGEAVAFDELVAFLKLTGRFTAHARDALARFALEGNELDIERAEVTSAQALYDAVRVAWGWYADEEVRVTLRDLGLGTGELQERFGEEAAARSAVSAVAREGSEEFLGALRVELFMNELALKREAARLGSVHHLARRARNEGAVLTDRDRELARRVICACLDAPTWDDALHHLATVGLAVEEAERFVEELGLARVEGGRVLRAMANGAQESEPVRGRLGQPSGRGLGLRRSPKTEGDRRFCMPLGEALAATRRLREVLGISRVGMIGELDTLGVHVAQAFRPGSTWSSSFGSGKSLSAAGAKVGSVMEEVEKYAQEQFPRDDPRPEVVESYARLRRRHHALDPAALDLPYDTCYRPDLPIGWREAYDLLDDARILVPSAALVAPRVLHDIYYSARLGMKVFRSNGLASGFTLEEAVTHAAAEVIERHAQRLAELRIANPGGVGPVPYRFVALDTAPASVRRIVRKVRRAGFEVRLLDITSDVRVPTFHALIYDDYFLGRASQVRGATQYDGFAAHPDPEVAACMALLEAAQTRVGNVAASREDLHVKARSLGRHERPRTQTRAGRRFLFGPDPPTQPFDAVHGFTSTDALQDLRWIARRLRAADLRHLLVVDYSVAEIAPARAVRVLIPGLESTNPFHTGVRARAALVADLMPG